jgi:hypothetical protein
MNGAWEPFESAVLGVAINNINLPYSQHQTSEVIVSLDHYNAELKAILAA